MENASYIYFKNSGGTAQNAIGLNSSNALLIGYGTARSGYETYLDGKYISIRTFPDNGANSQERIRITAAGDVGIGRNCTSTGILRATPFGFPWLAPFTSTTRTC